MGEALQAARAALESIADRCIYVDGVGFALVDDQLLDPTPNDPKIARFVGSSQKLLADLVEEFDDAERSHRSYALREAVETAVDFAAVVLGTRPRSTIDDERPKDYVSRHLAEALDTLRTRLATIEAPLREEIESLRTALANAESTIAKLREMVPSDIQCSVTLLALDELLKRMRREAHLNYDAQEAIDAAESAKILIDAARGGAK